MSSKKLVIKSKPSQQKAAAKARSFVANASEPAPIDCSASDEFASSRVVNISFDRKQVLCRTCPAPADYTIVADLDMNYLLSQLNIHIPQEGESFGAASISSSNPNPNISMIQAFCDSLHANWPTASYGSGDDSSLDYSVPEQGKRSLVAQLELDDTTNNLGSDSAIVKICSSKVQILFASSTFAPVFGDVAVAELLDAVLDAHRFKDNSADVVAQFEENVMLTVPVDLTVVNPNGTNKLARWNFKIRQVTSSS